MTSKKHALDNYKRYLLSRATTNAQFVETIENILMSEDEAANYSFHKIMIHSWKNTLEELFDMITEYFMSMLIPVNVIKQGDLTTFYTSNLTLILKIIRLDFMFPYQRNMFNIDILFNDKTSLDFFENKVSLDDIVAGVVSQRFNERQELDLSEFCSDKELEDKKIYFYKLYLLSYFKILMLRMGRDAKALNLSRNNLSQPPVEIMNFFIKGDLTEINLSYNKIASIADLFRVSSKIEKLWVEGNPMCEELEPLEYVKKITVKFPRLSELDGVKLNEHGFLLPFVRNYIHELTKPSKMVVEKFLSLYFSRYDSRDRPQRIKDFYDEYATLSITVDFTEAEAMESPHFACHARNFLDKNSEINIIKKPRLYGNKHTLLIVLQNLAPTVHDPTTFTVDVMHHDKKSICIIVDGIFKEEDPNRKVKMYRFRRTFVLAVYKNNQYCEYRISNEMLHVARATKEQVANSFKKPIRNLTSFVLIDPEHEECEAIVKVFTHITQLKKQEATIRLRLHQWDIKEALKEFISDVNKNSIASEHFIEEDDFSDTSSLIDDEMVD